MRSGIRIVTCKSSWADIRGGVASSRAAHPHRRRPPRIRLHISPMFALKSRIVVCDISQNIASSTDWKSSRTACALGGVCRSSGKLAPLQGGRRGTVME